MFIGSAAEKSTWTKYACCVSNTGPDVMDPDSTYDVPKFLAAEADRSARKEGGYKAG